MAWICSHRGLGCRGAGKVSFSHHGVKCQNWSLHIAQQSQSQLQPASTSKILYTPNQKTYFQNSHCILARGFTLELSHSTNHAHHKIKYNNQQVYLDTTTQECYIGFSDQTDFEAVSPEGGGDEQLNFRLMNKPAHQYYCNGILLCKHPCRDHPTVVNHLTIWPHVTPTATHLWSVHDTIIFWAP